MRPRFVGRLGVADAVTIANALVGFVAVVVASANPGLAARLILLAAIGDGLDGVLARRYGGTPAGEYLDSLSDVVSFGVAPAALVVAVAGDGWELTLGSPDARTVGVLVVAGAFVAMAVTRLALYTAHDAGDEFTEGVQSTLAATVLAAGVLAGFTRPALVVGAAALLTYLMVVPIRYPDLLARDALLMGVVQALAVLLPDFLGRTFPYALLTLALSYLLFGPWFYWRGGVALARLKGNA